ncbi:MAG: hypothetical protein PVJ72_18165 [Gammaproteobacteria bacterium]
MSETTFLNIGVSEIEKIRRLCQSPLNWSDGGYWMGNGPEPNCSLSQEQIKTSKISIKWPNQESVDRWNDNWSKAQRRMGYLGTALISTLLWEVQLTRTAFLAVVGGDLLVDILKGESIAAIPYPKPKAGWTMETTLDFYYRKAVSPSKNMLRVKKTIKMYDENMKLVDGPSVNTVEFTSDEVPHELSKMLFAQPGTNVSYEY